LDERTPRTGVDCEADIDLACEPPEPGIASDFVSRADCKAVAEDDGDNARLTGSGNEGRWLRRGDKPAGGPVLVVVPRADIAGRGWGGFCSEVAPCWAKVLDLAV